MLYMRIAVYGKYVTLAALIVFCEEEEEASLTTLDTGYYCRCLTKSSTPFWNPDYAMTIVPGNWALPDSPRLCHLHASALSCLG